MNPRCMGCMSEIPLGMNFCPVCGYKQGNNTSDGMYIPEGSMVGQYLIGRVLGHGGFGITYIGWDETAESVVAIKEYFPSGVVGRAADGTVAVYTDKQAVFDAGLARFQQEAEMIRQFGDFPGIVDYRDYFETQGSGYFVMEYVHGITMKDYVTQRGGRIPFKDVRAILMPIMDALEEMHRRRIIHRDISPDNIYITQSKQVKLLDFGAARYDNVNEDRNLSVILKHGYAPKEQYFVQGHQGPWTDVYAVAATAYHMMSGQVPQSSIERLESDRLMTLSHWDVAIPAPGEQIIMQALAIQETQRFPRMKAFQSALLSVNTSISPSSIAPPVMGMPVNPMWSPPAPPQPHPNAFSVQPYHAAQPHAPVKPTRYKPQNLGEWFAMHRVLALTAVIILFALISVGSIFLNAVEMRYQRSLQHMADHQYYEAIHLINELPDGYRDTERLIDYVKGMEQMAVRNYANAQEIFAGLPGNYRDVHQLRNYTRVGRYLQIGDWERAQTLMLQIERDDTHQFQQEIQYQMAQNAFSNRAYQEAYHLMKQLDDAGGYRASTAHLECMDLGERYLNFRLGVRAYQSGDYSLSAEKLESVYNQPMTRVYDCLLLMQALEGHVATADKNRVLRRIRNVYGFTSLDDVAQTVMAYPDLEDASEMLMTDKMIAYFLEGVWENASGWQLTVSRNGTSRQDVEYLTDYSFSVQQNIVTSDGDHFLLRGSTLYYGSAEDGWTQHLRLEYLGMDQLKVTAVKSGRIWILERQ